MGGQPVYPVRRFDSRVVPKHPLWRARRVLRDGITVAVRVRHRLLPWRAFEVDAGSLRSGAERASRMLSAHGREAWRADTGPIGEPLEP